MYSVVLATLITAGSATPAWGHGCHGCHGCWGGCHGCWGGCHGCWGGCYGYAAALPAYGYTVLPTYGYAALSSGNVINSKANEGGNEGGTNTAYSYGGDGLGRTSQKASPRQATVVVHLPAEAKLYVDGKSANLTSKTRSFVTPELQKGQDYYYTVKAEVRRDGVTREHSQRVFVRAGTVAHVDLDPLNPVDVATTNLSDRASARR
jgi:uncharacterized protein (TIGR03000 family)